MSEIVLVERAFIDVTFDVDPRMIDAVRRARALRTEWHRLIQPAPDGHLTVGHQERVDRRPDVAEQAAPKPYADATQAKDIPDNAVLLVVLFGAPLRLGAQRRDVVLALGANEKIVMAKVEKLIRRGMLDGCTCGCRGDFVIAAVGDAMLMDPEDRFVDGVPDRLLPAVFR